MTQRGEAQGDKLSLVIPNTEIRNIFTKQISEWIQNSARQDGEGLNRFCDAFRNGAAAGGNGKVDRFFKGKEMEK